MSKHDVTLGNKLLSFAMTEGATVNSRIVRRVKVKFEPHRSCTLGRLRLDELQVSDQLS